MTSKVRLSEYGEDLVWEYDIALADNHAIDFTDLITGAYEFLQDDAICRRWREKFRFISVDEMQDTSEVEYTVISRLFPGPQHPPLRRLLPNHLRMAWLLSRIIWKRISRRLSAP